MATTDTINKPDTEDDDQVDIKETLARIAHHKGVLGYMFLRPADGRLLEVVGFNDDRDLIFKYAKKLHAFTILTQYTVRTIDHEDELTALRMRIGLREILVVVDPNNEYALIVVQDQVSEEENRQEILKKALAEELKKAPKNNINSATSSAEIVDHGKSNVIEEKG